ncbi:MAG: hypothetical protein MI807_20395 [Verrucomicrobiales bacterium]|nr:hypothetical protein [Verrucomicrobiales bacterium]
MPKHTHSPGERWYLRTPRIIFRWLLRFLGWSFLAVLAAVVLVAILAVILYANRERVVNEALARFVEPFEVSVGAIHVRDIGKVKVEDLHLSPRGTTSEVSMIRIPELHLTYDFDRLRQNGEVKTIVIEKPEILVTDHFLGNMPESSPGSEDSSASVDLADFSYFTESLEIRGGQMTLQLPGIPEISTTWNLNTGPLTYGDSGAPDNSVSVELTDISVGEEDKAGNIDTATAEILVYRDLSRIDVPILDLSGIAAEVTPNWFSKPEENAPVAGKSTPERNNASDFPEMFFEKIRIGQSEFSLTGFDGSEGSPSLPDVSFETEIEFLDVSYSDGRWKSPAPLRVDFSAIAIGEPTSQLASIDRISVMLENPGKLIHDRTISGLTIDGIDVLISDKSIERLRKETETTTTASSASDSAPWILESLKITDGTFLLQGATFGGQPAPRVETSLSGEFFDLRVGGEDGFSSQALQKLSLGATTLRSPEVQAGNDPLVSFESGELVLRWSDFTFNNTIETLTLDNPKITFTDEALGAWLNPDEKEEVVGPINRPVYKVQKLQVTGGQLEADSQFAAGRVPKIYSDFSIRTNDAEEAAPFTYEIDLENFELRNHAVSIEFEGPPAPRSPTLFPDQPDETAAPSPIAEEEVLSIKNIQVTATADQLQRTRRIGTVTIDGAEMKIGEGLKAIVDSGKTESEADETSAPEPTEPRQLAANELPTWSLEEVQITRSRVFFEALVPQVEGLEFDVETILTDVPLSPDELLAQDKLQKIELAGIEIKDPYDSFITVATLPTIFVEFSLAGLASQEVEKIDLIGPSLHVGQGLFWWIDYQRNFREQNEGASIGLEEDSLPEEATASPDWVVKTINATAGKIVIAPTGIPIGMVPFPFNATTSMADGKTELKLSIPDEDYVYRFPDYKVDLYGLTGDVEFNVPVEEVNNNLVQTFALDKLVWKKYEAENLFLTVTFDENGIYGALGGDAYGGYAEGGFNFYLNEDGKWDAWVAGTNMEAMPITNALAPENFQMDGPISLKIVSGGRKKALGETTGEFQTSAPGWFDIKKFDAILDKLPADWTNLKKSLAELGLIAVKRFDYDKGSGSLYLLGRDGELDLRFTGPYGSRELTFHLHDDRAPDTTVAAAGPANETETQPEGNAAADPPRADNQLTPEASARPVASRGQ